MEKFSTHGQVTAGSDKTAINLFNPAATPVNRGAIAEIIVGCVATPADLATRWHAGRSTALGTEGSGFTPVNLDPAGPAGAYDSGIAHAGGSGPTYTASKELLDFSVHQRATFRWIANQGYELLMAATQNYGIGLYTKSSGGTTAHEATILFQE